MSDGRTEQTQGEDHLRNPADCVLNGGHAYPNGRYYGDGKCVWCGKEQMHRPMIRVIGTGLGSITR